MTAATQNSCSLFHPSGRDVPRPTGPSLGHSILMMNSDCAAMSSKESASEFQAKCLNRSLSQSRARAWDVSDVHPKHSIHFRTMVADSICNYSKKDSWLSFKVEKIPISNVDAREKAQNKSIDTKLAGGYNLVSN